MGLELECVFFFVENFLIWESSIGENGFKSWTRIIKLIKRLDFYKISRRVRV